MANLLETLRTAGVGVSQMTGVRQLALLVGLAASIALGGAVVMWSQEPNYRPLYNHVDHAEMSNMLDALDHARIRYKLDNGSNMVLVPANEIYKARIHLASAGLPKNKSVGFEMLNQDQGMTTSRFMETARYRHALEGELGRTISHLEGVIDARVHLAIPRQSSFLEDDEKPSASVLVNLGGMQKLDKANVAAISRLVASSIPGLESHNVTVVDHTGRVLSQEADNNHFAQTKEQFEYQRQFEHNLEQRIEAIVTPLIGAAKVRAKITANLDFTHIEQTQENYNQATPIIRSEEVFNERRGQFGDDEPKQGGVPGAMASAPPPAAVMVSNAEQQANKAASDKLSSLRQHTTRNYEVGKTISHTLVPSGLLKRLSIAVVVDDKASMSDDGKVNRTPLSDDEIAKITALVKNAVGYDQARGDTISVVNSSFAPAKIIEPLPPVAWYEQAWVWVVAKTVSGGLFVLLLLLMVIRPVMRTLAEKGTASEQAAKDNPGKMPSMPHYAPMPQPMMQAPAMSMAGGAMPASTGAAMPAQMGAAMQGPMPAMTGQGGAAPMMMPGGSEQGWSHVRSLASEDPKRMAQVMKDWVNK